jgi:hypothetical protein
MGVVYRAWQPSLGRQVALKCLLRSGDPKAEARFAREIRALGRVEHPNLVKVFTSGAEGEQWFYAMELVEGATLAAVCDRLTAGKSSAAGLDLGTWQEALGSACEERRRAEQPPGEAGDKAPPPGRASAGKPAAGRGAVPLGGRDYVRHVVKLVRQVAEAAHALHESGVLHRDIKPGNIMASADGAQAVLMDLGLAQLTDEVEGRLTRTRQFVGTLRYASPQQVLAVGKLDRRSDVYSLGATLWELLTLRPIYGADEQTPTPELMERIQHGEPERLRKYHPGIARDLEAIVRKCLEKEPARRYATAHELAEDLARWERGDVVLAQRLTARYLLGKYLRRYRLRVAAVAGILAATLVGMAVALWQINEARLAALRAQGDAESKSREANRERQNTRAALVQVTRARTRALAARNAERKGRALAYVNQAELFLQRHDLPGAAAYLMQAVTLDPDNAGALARLLDLLEQRSWIRTDGPVVGAAFDAGGDFCTVTRQGRLEWWDRSAGVRLVGPVELGKGVRLVAFSPDRTVLAHTTPDLMVLLRKMPTGQLVASLEHTAPVNAISFSADGKRLVTAAGDWRDELGYAQVWSAADGAPIGARLVHWGRVAQATFSPDGRRVATASWDWTARVWDARTGKPVSGLMQHRGWVSHVRFSQDDGKWLLTSSWDGTVGVWDASSGRRLSGGTLEQASGRPPRRVACADFLPARSGKTLAGSAASAVGLMASPDGLGLFAGTPAMVPRVRWVVACGSLTDQTGFLAVWRREGAGFVRDKEFTYPAPLERVSAPAGYVILAQSVNSAVHLAPSAADPTSREFESKERLTALPMLAQEAMHHRAGLTGFATSTPPGGGSPDDPASQVRVLTFGEDHTARLWQGQRPANFLSFPGTVPAATMPAAPGKRKVLLRTLSRLVGQITELEVAGDGKLRSARRAPEAVGPPEGRVASASWDRGDLPADRLTRYLATHFERASRGHERYASSEWPAGRADRMLDAARRGLDETGQRLLLTPRAASAWAVFANLQAFRGLADLHANRKAEGRGRIREALKLFSALEEKCGNEARNHFAKAVMTAHQAWHG